MFQVAARSFWHVWSVVSAKEQKSARSARHRSFALQPANHGPSERFDAVETAGLHAAAASLPSRRGLGDDDRAAGRRHADYEYALHLNQLDLVTAFAGDRPDGRLATVPSPGATHLSILTSSKCSPLSCRSRGGAAVASARSASAAQAGCGFWTTTRWRGDDKQSQPNAKLANGQQVCMRCARPSTRRRAGPWAPETGAAQQEQPPRHGSSYCRRRNEHGKIGSPPSLHLELLNGV